MSMSWINSAAASGLRLLGRSAVGLTVCSLLAGCVSGGTSGAATSTPGAGRTTRAEHGSPRDWRYGTYTMTCDGLDPGGFSVTLVKGAGRAPADVGDTPYYDHFDVRYEADASGDIDGDGKPDTVVLLRCSPQPSNGFVEEVQVFSPARGRLGVLPSPSTLPEAVGIGAAVRPGRAVGRSRRHRGGHEGVRAGGLPCHRPVRACDRALALGRAAVRRVQ